MHCSTRTGRGVFEQSPTVKKIACPPQTSRLACSSSLRGKDGRATHRPLAKAEGSRRRRADDAYRAQRLPARSADSHPLPGPDRAAGSTDAPLRRSAAEGMLATEARRRTSVAPRLGYPAAVIWPTLLSSDTRSISVSSTPGRSSTIFSRTDPLSSTLSCNAVPISDRIACGSY